MANVDVANRVVGQLTGTADTLLRDLLVTAEKMAEQEATIARLRSEAEEAVLQMAEVKKSRNQWQERSLAGDRTIQELRREAMETRSALSARKGISDPDDRARARDGLDNLWMELRQAHDEMAKLGHPNTLFKRVQELRSLTRSIELACAMPEKTYYIS